ncbi:hypothetical protein LTR62_001871 [Meristemomyces frigidus]|uniref:Uncharacterized protein n=1 Tax=Meristemomyces frigidus TaxID=1508187 RepID=A0AAN7YB23_9PEZI|nr:hypothetical protein LTR62_001871 [Meristemomyces frigidus]
MADTKPTLPSRPSTTSVQPNGSQAAMRNRMSVRQPTIPEYSPMPNVPSLPPPPRPSNSHNLSPAPQLLRRRSSLMSDVTSFSEDIINPSTKRHESHNDDMEPTHWHSTPLAFAILPALGGLLFKNGSAFVTDVLLLGLAAVFLNWSIRIPWSWYYESQALRRNIDPHHATLDDDDLDDDVAVHTDSSTEGLSQLPSGEAETQATEGLSQRQTEMKTKAAADLRAQEKLAFLATFVFPVMAAYLLHIIRDQLSRPAEGLISDYNLSIFLLAAEIRPARQLIRLISARTLHLQRTVSGKEAALTKGQSSQAEMTDLHTRLAELETKLSDHSLIPTNITIAQKDDVTELNAEMRKRYEPRLEGLERAVRRYEKRSTTLTMVIEQRLNSLETRLQEALSLAAVAAQSSQQRRNVFAYFFELISMLIALPMRIAWSLCLWPLLLLEQGWGKLSAMLSRSGPGRREAGAKARSKYSGKDEGRGNLEEKQRLKSSMRKIVR